MWQIITAAFFVGSAFAYPAEVQDKELLLGLIQGADVLPELPKEKVEIKEESLPSSLIIPLDQPIVDDVPVVVKAEVVESSVGDKDIVQANVDLPSDEKNDEPVASVEIKPLSEVLVVKGEDSLASAENRWGRHRGYGYGGWGGGGGWGRRSYGGGWGRGWGGGYGGWGWGGGYGYGGYW